MSGTLASYLIRV
ncbi:hypothetical protein F383_27084 [Gossypium arboreum]|nr:hypothetical protein F383_27084 [Gossypium arboreum]